MLGFAGVEARRLVQYYITITEFELERFLTEPPDFGNSESARYHEVHLAPPG
jgi:hypothetical protein